jgi:hypothetical protein
MLHVWFVVKCHWGGMISMHYDFPHAPYSSGTATVDQFAKVVPRDQTPSQYYNYVN